MHRVEMALLGSALLGTFFVLVPVYCSLEYKMNECDGEYTVNMRGM